MKKFLAWISLFFFFTPGHTQTNIDFGVLGGVALYTGDLSPENAGFSYEELGPTAGAFLRFQYKDWVSLRTGLTYLQLLTDPSRLSQLPFASSFETNVFELSGIVEISPFNIGYFNSGTVILPYVAVGAGIFRFNPRTEFNDRMIDLQPLGTEGQGLPGYEDRYSLTSFNFPFGVGIRFIFNDQWSVGVEILGRKLQTDYIDDVSDTVVRYGDILENRGRDIARISAPGVAPNPRNLDLFYQRGGSFNDFYYIGNINISYRIRSNSVVFKSGKKGVVCPRF